MVSSSMSTSRLFFETCIVAFNDNIYYHYILSSINQCSPFFSQLLQPCCNGGSNSKLRKLFHLGWPLAFIFPDFPRRIKPTMSDLSRNHNRQKRIFFSSAHYAKQECYEPQPIINFHKPFRSTTSLLIDISKNSTKLYWKIQWNLNKFRHQFLSDHGHMCPKITSQNWLHKLVLRRYRLFPTTQAYSARRQLSNLRRSNSTISATIYPAKISLTIRKSKRLTLICCQPVYLSVNLN